MYRGFYHVPEYDYIWQISMESFGYFIRTCCNIPCCSVRIWEAKAIARYKQVHVSCFSKPAVILLVQKHNYWAPRFTGTGNVDMPILVPAPQMVGSPAEMLETVGLKNYHTACVLTRLLRSEWCYSHDDQKKNYITSLEFQKEQYQVVW
jgi:hypothetical protein